MHAVLKMITGTFCSRLLGFLRDIVFFAILGSSLEASAFLIAFSIPNLFRRLCGEGALSSAFIPIFAQRYVKQPKTAHAFLNAFFTRFGVYLGGSIVMGMVLLALIHNFLNDTKWSTVLYLTNAMLPYLWFICMAALLNGTLNVLNAFSLTAFSPVFLNLSMLTGLFVCSFYENNLRQVSIVSIFVILGGILQWFLPKMQLTQKGYPLQTFSWQADPDLRRIWLLFVPSILGAAIFQINAMLGRFFAYILDERSVSFLYLANRFLELPLGLFAFAIISIILPKLSLYTAQQNESDAQKILKQGINLLLLLLIPAAIGLFILAQPILEICFCWGNFSHNDAKQVVPLLQIFAVGLPLFGITSLLTRVFYAHKDTVTPVKLSFITLIAYVASFACLCPFFNLNSLALASVLSTCIQLILQIKIIKQRYPFYPLNVLLYFRKKWSIFLIYTGLLLGIAQLCTWTQQKTHDALQISWIVIVGVLIYLILLKCLDKKSFKSLIKLQLN